MPDFTDRITTTVKSQGVGATVVTNSDNTDASGAAIQGFSNGVGVHGQSRGWHGVAGISKSTKGGHGVYGLNVTDRGYGVRGESSTSVGVYGVSGFTEQYASHDDQTVGVGVKGEHAAGGIGVEAVSKLGEGLRASTNSPTQAAVAALNDRADGTGAALFARKLGTEGHAGFFLGRVFIRGELLLEVDERVDGRLVQHTVNVSEVLAALSDRVLYLEKLLLNEVDGMGRRLVDLEQQFATFSGGSP